MRVFISLRQDAIRKTPSFRDVITHSVIRHNTSAFPLISCPVRCELCVSEQLLDPLISASIVPANSFSLTTNPR